MDSPKRIAKRCQSCGRGIFQVIAACPSCGGEISDMPKPDGTNRRKFFQRRDVCSKCEHYGLHARPDGTKEGCGLLEKPCRVEKAWLSMDENWCPLMSHDFANDTQTHPPTSSTQPDSTDESHDDRND